MPRKRNHFERRLQIFLVRQFRRLVDPLEATLVALENGEDRPASTLDLLAALGVEDGMPDLALLMTRRRIRWIEVKLEATLHHGRTEPNLTQAAFHDLLGYYGFGVDVVRNAAEFWAIVDAEGVAHRPLPATQPGLWDTPPTRRRRRE